MKVIEVNNKEQNTIVDDLVLTDENLIDDMEFMFIE
jgi:hypothetical protein